MSLKRSTFMARQICLATSVLAAKPTPPEAKRRLQSLAISVSSVYVSWLHLWARFHMESGSQSGHFRQQSRTEARQANDPLGTRADAGAARRRRQRQLAINHLFMCAHLTKKWKAAPATTRTRGSLDYEDGALVPLLSGGRACSPLDSGGQRGASRT